MIIKDFIKMIDDKKSMIIEFTPDIEFIETDFDTGMRAVVTGYKIEDEDLVKIEFDVGALEEYNEKFGKKKDPCLFWWESGYNKKRCLYFMITDTCAFKVVSDKSWDLYAEFKKSNYDKGYVKWLEMKLSELYQKLDEK